MKTAQFIELKPLKIYDKIDGKIIISANITRFHPFDVLKTKGYWIKIKQNSNYMYDRKIPKTGWAKWKYNNKLLIDIIEETYE